MKSKIMFSLNALLLVGSIFLFSSNSVFAEEDCFLKNNNNICISEEHYNNLLNLGFTDFEIQNIGQEEFDNNKDLEGQVVSTSTNYYKDTYYYRNGRVTTFTQEVTEAEYNNLSEIQGMSSTIGNSYGLMSYDGYTETTGKKMRTTIISLGSTMRYKNSVEWKNLPSVRSYDIIGIGIESEKVYYAGNRTFNQTYCISVLNCINTSSATFKNTETGMGASFKLAEGAFSKLSSYLYFDVAKKGNQTITNLYAYGDYSHATKTVSSSDAAYGYTIGSGGIHLSTTISSKYDAINVATANWAGTW